MHSSSSGSSQLTVNVRRPRRCPRCLHPRVVFAANALPANAVHQRAVPTSVRCPPACGARQRAVPASVRCPPTRGVIHSSGGSCASEEMLGTLGGGSSGSASSRRSSTARIPAASAPWMSWSSESPTCTARPGAHPASASAAVKISGAGFGCPTSAEVTTPSTIPSSPTLRSTAGSDTSQLLTTTSVRPRARSRASAAGTSG